MLLFIFNCLKRNAGRQRCGCNCRLEGGAWYRCQSRFWSLSRCCLQHLCDGNIHWRLLLRLEDSFFRRIDEIFNFRSHTFKPPRKTAMNRRNMVNSNDKQNGNEDCPDAVKTVLHSEDYKIKETLRTLKVLRVLNLFLIL